MASHIRLLIEPESDAGVGGLMPSLGRRHVGHIDRLHGRTRMLVEHGADAFGENDALVSNHGCRRALGRGVAPRFSASRANRPSPRVY